MRSPISALVLSALSLSPSLPSVYAFAAPSADDAPLILPCTAKGNGFYDLRPLTVTLPDPDSKKTGKEKADSWQSKGHDYPGNFSINICAPVVEEISDVVGIDKELWRNVSAYYEMDGKVFSIGQQSSNLTVRGRKLVLQYTDGSPCGPDADFSSLASRSYSEDSSIYEGSSPQDARRGRDTVRYPYHDSDDADDTDDSDTGKHPSDDSSHPSHEKPPAHAPLRKSTTLSFHCERDPLKALAQASFVSTDPYHCAYFFEIRSPFACAGSPPAELGAVGPGGVFVLIMCIAIAVYFAGGVMYNRSVGHARGWRQLPNYAFWSGCAGVLEEGWGVATSSCGRCLPRRRGYEALGGERGRRGGREDENRLIDDLDEEWEH